MPWRLSRHQKYRQRERLRHVDTIVSTLDTALRRMGQSMKKVERWKMEMPTEQEMLPKDKYTVFDRKVKRYRKGIHSRWCVLKLDCSWANKLQRCRSGRGSARDSIPRVSSAPQQCVGRSIMCIFLCYHTICIGHGAQRRTSMHHIPIPSFAVVVQARTRLPSDKCTEVLKQVIGISASLFTTYVHQITSEAAELVAKRDHCVALLSS